MTIRMAAAVVMGLMAAGGATAQTVPDQAATVEAEAAAETSLDTAAETPRSDGAQQAPGQPSGGIVVKGGQNPTQGAQRVAGNPIGGIIVKGGKNPGPKKPKK